MFSCHLYSNPDTCTRFETATTPSRVHKPIKGNTKGHTSLRFSPQLHCELL
uniref:Uncharacterized protein n=1 Tax=Anguilla anguilla TaxID=7936 RepID=A0A0E9PRY4_ANGAN